MKEYTLADELEAIGKELDECSQNNDCSECDNYSCPNNPERVIEEW